MLKKIDHRKMGKSDLGWLNSLFHFSFAGYFNEHNLNFGVLRVINDDLVGAKTGFELHPHQDMEIISYVVSGELTHGDNLGNKKTLTRGQVQYMSAGTGVYHSEHNLGDNVARFLQIWIIPDKNGHTPTYGDYRFDWVDRRHQWLQVVSSKDGMAPVKINQDVNIYVLELDENEEINFPVKTGRQAYLIQIEGASKIKDIILEERDALEIVEEDIIICSLKTAHFMVIEMAKSR
ncbi:MAG: pirin family protein [Candidatus Falkowbacteria bacterium]